jgi:hypothetical protein
MNADFQGCGAHGQMTSSGHEISPKIRSLEHDLKKPTGILSKIMRQNKNLEPHSDSIGMGL